MLQPNRFKALQDLRAKKLAEASALLNKPDATAEDRAAADAILAEGTGELAKIDAELAAFDRLHAAERTAPATGTYPATVTPRIEQDPKRGFANIGEFALAIRDFYTPGGEQDERLLIGAAPTNFHRETGSDEGRSVPPAFKQEVWEAVADGDDSLLNLVDAEPTSSNQTIIQKDETTPWGSTGVQAYWRAEGVQMSPSKLAQKEVAVPVHELYALCLATGELLQDYSRLSARLTKKSGQAIRYKLNEAIVNGTGAGQPFGWFTSTAKVTVSKETSQTADTVNATNVAKMYARLINPGQGYWFVNQDVLPQLFTMTIGDKPIWIPPTATIQNAPTGGYLFGRPVITLENCATVGDLGDIQFVNPKGYYAAVKGSSPEFAESMHLYFDYNVSAFRWIFRAGGQPYLSAAVSPAKGSSTRSHVVVLEAR